MAEATAGGWGVRSTGSMQPPAPPPPHYPPPIWYEQCMPDALLVHSLHPLWMPYAWSYRR